MEKGLQIWYNVVTVTTNQERSPMAIISETVLESNKKIRVNFDGGNLSSDGGLLLLKEFYHKLGVNSLLRNRFRTTDTASFRIHKDHENLLQMLYQITGAYFQDDHADSLRNDPVLNAVIGKTALASQPTLSRFHNLSAYSVPFSQPHG